MKYIRMFSDLTIDDTPLVGGKNSSLGEMYSKLTDESVRVPNGFAVTTDAYRHYFLHNNLNDKIAEVLRGIDQLDLEQLATKAALIRSWVYEGSFPDDLAEEIAEAYRQLQGDYGTELAVAVRSSATAEDLPGASFAGQQESYLNIKGETSLLETCRKVFASLFTARAISYRCDQGFNSTEIALSIGVQKMVRSDLASSGIIFSLDTETGFDQAIFITSAYGLGENIVQGKVNPDEFFVFKPSLKKGFSPIIRRQLGDKKLKMICSGSGSSSDSTRDVDVPLEDQRQFSLTDDQVLELARLALSIEEHYGRAMDVEWGLDGQDGQLYILQARPETVHANKSALVHETYKLESRGEVLASGKSLGQKIAVGPARQITDISQMNLLAEGDILVTDNTDPDWEPIMKKAGAIVTNRGGRTCHAAIIARELGIPAIVGTGDATEKIPDGELVTVSCAEGSDGFVYRGELPFEYETFDLSGLPRPKTRVMLNLANPDRAFHFSSLPVEGVGLARLEFIISETIGVHPEALQHFPDLSADVQQKIETLSYGYADPLDFYVKRMAEGVGMIAAAFYPRPVIIRLSDFKSNEYAKLIGGEAYEPLEENPMIGFRGASRYPSEMFRHSFALECAAMKMVREEMGLDNLALMIPFVRTVDEGKAVLEQMAKAGLTRGENDLKIYVMCEIPSNALLADAFLDHFDGFSIGSNDLTQLTLGVDRDSSLVEGCDERNPAVLQLMEMAIKACRRRGKYVGICGQAPSDFPEITRWLVEQGIESLSLNPDSVFTMNKVIVDMEAEKAKQEEDSSFNEGYED